MRASWKILAAVALLAACSTSTSDNSGTTGVGTTGGTSGGTTGATTGATTGGTTNATTGGTTNATTAGTTASGTTSGATLTVVNGCQASSYEDHTATDDSRAITPWDTSLGTKCVTIKVGQSVTWAASSGHPLEAHGGDSGNPIPSATNSTTVAFPAAGVFGFDCAFHHSLMQGAVHVVP